MQRMDAVDPVGPDVEMTSGKKHQSTESVGNLVGKRTSKPTIRSQSMLLSRLALISLCLPSAMLWGQLPNSLLQLPDSELVAAYDQAVRKNVLAAVNPNVFY